MYGKIIGEALERAEPSIHRIIEHAAHAFAGAVGGFSRTQRATMAMLALLQSHSGEDYNFDAGKIARRAYEVADAMADFEAGGGPLSSLDPGSEEGK